MGQRGNCIIRSEEQRCDQLTWPVNATQTNYYWTAAGNYSSWSFSLTRLGFHRYLSSEAKLSTICDIPSLYMSRRWFI